MSQPTISAGTTFAVAAVLPATVTQAGFEALAFTQIRGVKQVGDITTTYQTVARNIIGSSRTDQRRTGYANGNVQLELIRIADAGQTILKAALADPKSYSYRLTRRDGSRLYFTAGASIRKQGGFDPSSIADTAITLEIDSDIVEVD